MFTNLVVPVDGSPESLAAVPIAVAMADQVDGAVEVVTVVDPARQSVALETTALTDAVAGLGDRLGTTRTEPSTIVLTSDDVAGAIVDHVTASDGSMVLMSSHGRGRSAAVFGSTTDQVLRRLFGPIIVIGPHAEHSNGWLGGTYIVPIDGSASADTVLPIAGAWAVEFHGTPWVIEVVGPDTCVPNDVSETAMVSRHAHDLRALTGRDVEFDVVRDYPFGEAIATAAAERDASLIFIATHSRLGRQRLRAGSVTADVIRHARCPVVVHRPPTSQLSAG